MTTTKAQEPKNNTTTMQQRPKNDTNKLVPCWSHLTEGYLHRSIRRMVVGLGTLSATYPWTTVTVTVLTSLALLVIGYVTNFELELNQLYFVSPTNSLPRIHSDWIDSTDSGFPITRGYFFNVHRHGDNVLTAQAMQVALEAMDVLQTTPNYDELCRDCQGCSESAKEMLFDGTSYCRISSVTQFWQDDKNVFQQELINTTEEDPDDFVRNAVSQPTFPDGAPVFLEAIMGKYEGYNTTSGEMVNYANPPPLSLATVMQVYQQQQNKENSDNNSAGTSSSTSEIYLNKAQCLIIRVNVPDIPGSTISDDFEVQLLQRFKELQTQYAKEHQQQGIYVEYFTMNGYQYEMMRGAYSDMPLVGVLVVVMVAFSVLVFSDVHDRVQSRGMLGVYCFSCIGLSLCAGYGFMFILGVPVTTVAIMIPFVVCGVGLDDAFIITGAYFRRQRHQQQEQQQDGEGGEMRGVENGMETDQFNQHENNDHDSIDHDTTIATTLPPPSSQGSKKQDDTTLALIRATLNEVAVSITMTTITTLLAFITGGTSRIPAVRWQCWYAASTLFIIYIYQITCFTAFLVLDERRVQQRRKDLCIWIVVRDDHEEEDTQEDEVMKENPKVPDDEDENERETNSENISTTVPEENPRYNGPEPTSPVSPKEFVEVSMPASPEQPKPKRVFNSQSSDTLATTLAAVTTPAESSPKSTSSNDNKHVENGYAERLMGWYADHLLKPTSKVIVLLAFAVYTAGTVYSTTLLTQEFKVNDYIPADSYLTSSMAAYEKYSTYLMDIEVYFRNVDQSDPVVQQQMLEYVQELSGLEQIGDEPGFFWLRDFQRLAQSNQTEELVGIDLESLSFNAQLNLALSIPQLHQIYGRDIVRDPESGNITASRAMILVRDFDMYSVENQIELLLNQRDISLRQTANDPSKMPLDGGFNFFTFDSLYFYWELFSTAIDELILNTVLCVVVVTFVGFVLIPHWSAVCFVCPLLLMLYFNLMGTMQYCGIKINVISYFILVMSIGLLVDFLMHILLRFYETKGATRNEKAKEVLQTIGVSILMGALTTFLGVIPLAISSTKIFRMVFICFLAMVVLGAAAGLILLPVLLSLVGPVGSVHNDSPPSSSEDDASNDNNGTTDHKHEEEESKDLLGKEEI